MLNLLVCKALFGLLTFDLLGFNRSFSRMHQFVSNWRLAPRAMPSNEIDRICEAVNCACVWYPKRVRCLQRSAVTTCLLRSSGIPAQMVIGAQNLPLRAHAWTEIEGRAINERRDVRRIYGFLDAS